jgi:hypothetical protein
MIKYKRTTIDKRAMKVFDIVYGTVNILSKMLGCRQRVNFL